MEPITNKTFNDSTTSDQKEGTITYHTQGNEIIESAFHYDRCVQKLHCWMRDHQGVIIKEVTKRKKNLQEVKGIKVFYN